MTVPVVMKHDTGCPRHNREPDGGHTDAAKRLSDEFTLHTIAGQRTGVIAVALADGKSDHTVYPDKLSAVMHQHHNERWYAYVRLGAPSMSVCAAESVMRFQRQSYGLQRQHTDRDAPHGGLQVIPRLGNEEVQRQLAAMARNVPVAMGYLKGN